MTSKLDRVRHSISMADLHLSALGPYLQARVAYVALMEKAGVEMERERADVGLLSHEIEEWKTLRIELAAELDSLGGG